MNTEPILITIEARVAAPAPKAWHHWVSPEHITQWNAAADEWCCPWARIDLRVGGAFSYRMEARDGSIGFEFEGAFTEVRPHSLLVFALGDGRPVRVEFIADGDATLVRETFEAESSNAAEMQRTGWQNILNRFKSHVENA